MTNEFDMPDPEDEVPETVDEVDDAAVEEEAGAMQPASDFTGSEGMVALGGAILVAVYVLFGVILDDYWISWLPLFLAILAVVLPRLRRETVEKAARLPVLMKAIGYGLAVLGVLTIIEDLRFFDSYLDSVTEVIAAIATYAGFAIAFLGARGIET